ncbi:MAG: CvpA family protein, partial [Lachnospiraceae bacterium]|nr:CvpA family protein [Lachnospiraceae bacterium]
DEICQRNYSEGEYICNECDAHVEALVNERDSSKAQEKAIFLLNQIYAINPNSKMRQIIEDRLEGIINEKNDYTSQNTNTNLIYRTAINLDKNDNNFVQQRKINNNNSNTEQNNSEVSAFTNNFDQSNNKFTETKDKGNATNKTEKENNQWQTSDNMSANISKERVDAMNGLFHASRNLSYLIIVSLVFSIIELCLRGTITLVISCGISAFMAYLFYYIIPDKIKTLEQTNIVAGSIVAGYVLNIITIVGGVFAILGVIYSLYLLSLFNSVALGSNIYSLSIFLYIITICITGIQMYLAWKYINSYGVLKNVVAKYPA